LNRAWRRIAIGAVCASATFATAGFAPTGVDAQDPAAARSALRSGAYEDAIDQYERLLGGEPGSSSMRVSLMTAMVATGRYEDAVQVGRDAPDPTSVANATGEALLRLGRLDEAAAAFQAAIDADGVWRLTAEANLAELLFDRGRIDEAMERFDQFIDVYNAADGELGSRDLVAVGRAVRYLGRAEPELFMDALRAFDEAARTDPTWAEPLIRAGELFLEKYDSPGAKEELGKVLAQNPRHPDALFIMAQSLAFDGAAGTGPTLDSLLAVNNRHVEARALIATRHLSNEAWEEARAEAEAALEVNPNSLEALTALTGSYLLQNDRAAFASTRSRALAINPAYAQMDIELAELSVQTRRYAQAVERAQAAVALDSAAWEGWGLMGMNQLRLGDIEAGRANLERAFEGDPYNPWFKNNLDLLDTFDRYEPHRTAHFELFLHGTEDELLANYLAPIAEEAFDSLSRRYSVEPTLPVRAELFPNHADFSVRTLGEAGLGALGVSFGRVLVMDSPSAREVGDYNWASVFWHELAHTFHLALSDNRVPRWFSEGLAVHEQRKAREGWGHQPSIQFLTALREERLKKVSELNDGFMRPDYPNQVIFSYYQASLVFQLIEDTYGFEAIRNMLVGYRDGRSTAQLFEQELDVSVEDFDDTFDGYIRDRFATPLAGLVPLGDPPGPEASIDDVRAFAQAHPGDLVTRLRLGSMFFRDERWGDAEEEFGAALRIFPEYGGRDSPYYFLARIHRQRGELEQAQAALARLNALSESNYDALLLQAEILSELDRPAESAAALDKAVQIWPYEIDLHVELASLQAALGDAQSEVRERAAVVALDPVDRAEALYLLATAQHGAGDLINARRSVMGALSIAPNYDEALELLLLIRSAGS
jgi:tetratricopeptide (TPR) repeat protein